ncbi:MAG: acyl-CoA dehydrogenase family protein [Nocardioides sp.]|uniref:acyl-CoA dehydrogenase family protein n=1 Tax=Nocardioides sp. TaxID=35761 RepID=UPI0039E3FDD7
MSDVRASAAGIAARFGAPYFLDCARAARFPGELWQELAEAGLIGIGLPVAYGGGGAGLVDLAAVTEELAAAGCPLQPLIYSQGIGGSIIAAHGTADQQAAWLPGLAAGTRILSFAITETEAGSNSQRLVTTAVRGGDDFVLNGAKTFVSGVERADAVLIAARTGTTARGKAALSIFLVPPDTPGVRLEPHPLVMVAPDKQWNLRLEQVRLPWTALVGELDGGLKALFDGFNPERILSAALGLGLGRYALGRAAAYARSRVVWEVPIGAHQGVAHALAQVKVELESARLHTERAAALVDAGQPAGEAANMAKMVAADAAVRSLDAAIQVHGGSGLALETGLSDFWWMVRALQVAPVSREMVLNFVAEHALGLPKSY